MAPPTEVTRFESMDSPRTDVALFVIPRGIPATGWSSGALLAGALVAFEPDVILLDVPAEPLQAVRDGARPNSGMPPWSLAPEVLETLLPLADELRVPVLGFSPWTEQVQADREAYDAAEPHGPPHRAYLFARARAQATLLEAQASGDPGWAYDESLDERTGEQARWLSYYAEPRLRHAGVLRLLSRKAGAIDDVLDTHRSERVAIVIALEDRFYLGPAIGLRDDVELVPVRPFFR